MAEGPQADRRRTCVVGAIILTGRRVLLGYRHPDRQHFPACWDVPGGHVEVGETSQDALRRELREELGIEADVGDLSADFRILDDDFDLQLWIVRIWRGELTNCAPQEHAELAWFGAEKLGSLPFADTRYLEILSAAISAGDP